LAERARESAVLMRSPQPVARSRVKLRSGRVQSLIALRLLRERRVKTAMGNDRNAQVRGEGKCLAFDALVLGVAMVRVKAFEVAPGGTMGGLNDAFARLGRPVAASAMGLDMLP
jgi:hypothetical protein